MSLKSEISKTIRYSEIAKYPEHHYSSSDPEHCHWYSQYKWILTASPQNEL